MVGVRIRVALIGRDHLRTRSMPATRISDFIVKYRVRYWPEYNKALISLKGPRKLTCPRSGSLVTGDPRNPNPRAAPDK